MDLKHSKTNNIKEIRNVPLQDKQIMFFKLFSQKLVRLNKISTLGEPLQKENTYCIYFHPQTWISRIVRETTNNLQLNKVYLHI